MRENNRRNNLESVLGFKIMMIHGSSHDPVLVKKISLRIWTLRDEIESVIDEKALTDSEPSTEDVDQIRQEYSHKSPSKNASEPEEKVEEETTKVSNEVNDEGLDAFEAASAEVEAADEEEVETDPGQEEAAKNDAEEALVSQRRPVIPEDKIIRAVSILSEVSMDGIYLFSNKEVMPGQSIVVDFVVPKKFIVNAEVLSCRPYNMKSRIISDNKMPFRCAIRFTFLKEGERTLLRQFLESIEPDLKSSKESAEIAKAAAKTDDDLGDLDDLDL